MKAIESENLSVRLQTQEILHRVSLSLNEGEIVGLIGPNGAGKSTWMKALLRLLPRSAGQIRICGKDERAYSRRALAREIAYMPQGEWVHWPISVKRVVALGRTPHLMPWQQIGQRDFQKIENLLDKIGIAHLAERSMDQLAGGERRLVLLARVLAAETKIIFTDEPIAALDPAHELQVMELLKSLSAEGRSVLVITHNLTLAARFCDRLVLLHAGKVISAGAPEQVLTPAHLSRSYGIEAHYGRYDSKFFIVPWSRR